MKFKGLSGYAPSIVLLVIAFLVTILLAGYTIYYSQKSNEEDSKAPSTIQTQSENQSVTEIKSAEDLNKAEQQLDNTQTESTDDNTQLENELNSF